MAYTEHYFTRFYEHCYYHIYNRCVNRKPLFTCAENYRYFLRQYKNYISPVAETHAYCLMGNHFHLLIRINLDGYRKNGPYVRYASCAPEASSTVKQLTKLSAHPHPRTPPPSQLPSQLPLPEKAEDMHNVVSHQFRRFFQSYAMAFNKQENRVGTLFQTPFKRAYIDNERYLREVLAYIHRNPERHGIIEDYRKWPWSSYNEYTGKAKHRIIETNSGLFSGAEKTEFDLLLNGADAEAWIERIES